MRVALFLLLALLGSLSRAQSEGNLFTSTRPDLTIVVAKHSTGLDTVEITPTTPDYPPELLQKQIEGLAGLLNASPSGLMIGPYQFAGDTKTNYIQAKFAVPGLIDRQAGVLRVEPFAKAFAGAPKGQETDVLMIRFRQETPGENTLQGFYPQDKSVRVQAMVSPGEAGVEYRLQLLTQDPAKISIPDDRRKPRQPVAKPVPPASSSQTDWVLVGVLVVAALAVGALVYSLLLRPRGPRARRA